MQKGNETSTYKYNDSGIRTEKTVNGTTIKYYLNGSKIIYEKTINETIYYTYDSQGEMIGLKHNNIQYYYIKNIQNDIIGILDSNLNQIASYTYDSWGKIESIKDNNGNEITDENNIANKNPYRYRSYRYDKETGLYYLQSRYYNADWGRFVNVDYTMLDPGAGLIGHNMYLYCANNPIKNYDPDGRAVLISLVLAVTAITSGIITAITVAEQTKKETGKVDWSLVIPHSIINACTFAMVGVAAANIGASGSTTSNYKSVSNSINKSVSSTSTVLPKFNTKPLDISSYSYSNTINKPEYFSTRPYMNSTMNIQNILSASRPIEERPGVFRWEAPGSFNNSNGKWEIIVNVKQQVIGHYLFKGDNK